MGHRKYTTVNKSVKNYKFSQCDVNVEKRLLCSTSILIYNLQIKCEEL